MRKIHKMLLFCICSCLMFSSCDNQTVVVNGDGTVQQGENENVDKGKKESKNEVNVSAVVDKTVKTPEPEKVEVEKSSYLSGSIEPGLKSLMENVETIHPNAYVYESKDTIISRGNEILKNEKLDDYLKIRKLIALYKEPSIRVVQGNEVREKLNLDIKVDSRGIYIEKSSGSFKVGDKIVKIGKSPVGKILDEALTYVSGYTKEEVYCEKDMILRDKNFLGSVVEIKDEQVSIEILRDNILMIFKSDFIKDTIYTAIENSSEVIDGTDIAVIKINQFNGEDDVQTIDMINRFFNDIGILGVNNLVVDLSGAGNISYDILSVIGPSVSGDQYYVFEDQVKESSQWKESSFKKDGFLKGLFSKDYVKVDKKRESIYSKGMYVVVNGESSYDAIKAAVGLKRNFGAKIIGATPYSDVNGFGNSIQVKIDGMNTVIEIPTTFFKYLGAGEVDFELDEYICDTTGEKEQLENILSKIK